MTPANKTELLECTTSIISAYVANNTIPKENLVALIADTFKSLAQLGRAAAPVDDLKPAVPIKRSVQPDHIICLEDGKKFKSLKRHLMTYYNMTPQDYREKWGLPGDYPMVAPDYALARSQLAKKIGLGQHRTRAVIAQPAKTAARQPKKALAAKMGGPEKVPATKKGAPKKAAATVA